MLTEEDIAADPKLKLDPRIAGWALRLGVLALISVLFAVAGPFGTYEAGDFGERLLYWVVVIGVSVAVAVVIIILANRFLSEASILTRECVSVIVMTVVFTVFLQIWTGAAFPGHVSSPPGYLFLASEMLVICTTISVMKYWVPKVIGTPERQSDLPEQPRLARRLPQGFSGQICRLTVNGHKVLVVTSQGTFDLRMRFADAVDEAVGLDGFCTHRSHWVNQAAIDKIITRGGRPVILMSNGDEVPVSRKYQGNVEAAGLI